MLIFAVVFLAVIFIFKNKTVFQNNGSQVNQEGLTYGNETLESIINKDTDGDMVLDWEENLWGTDPLKKDSNDDGVEDDVEIAKLKAAEETTFEEQTEIETSGTETLTETDKFSRELFSTLATLSQAGEIDQATVDKLSSSLAEQIKNPPVYKVYFLSDLKITPDDSLQAVKNFSTSLDNLYAKQPKTKSHTVMDILGDFIVDENNVNIAVLSELDPIINQTNGIIDELLKMTTPQSLAPVHLEVINTLQRLSENLSSIKLFDTDTVLALGAITQYEKNTDALGEAIAILDTAIQMKMN